MIWPTGTLLLGSPPGEVSCPKSLEFAAAPWSQTGQFAAWLHSPGNAPTRQISIDGPQVFRSLSVGARVQPGIMGAQSRGVFGGGGAGVDHHRPPRLPRNATGAGDLDRCGRAGLSGLSRPAVSQAAADP